MTKNQKAFITEGVTDSKTFKWDSLPPHDNVIWSVTPSIRNSAGVVFSVGEEVGHRGAEDTAVIDAFILDPTNQDIIAKTSKGIASVEFLLKRIH